MEKSKIIEQEKKLNKLILEMTKSRIEELEKDRKVYEYKKEQETYQKEKEYQEYLEQIEIGEDETLFVPKTTDKETKNYTLLDIIRNAFTLKYLKHIDSVGISSYDESYILDLSYEELIEYGKKSYQKLTQMKKQEDDKVAIKTKNLKIYENPKNIKFTNVKEELSKLTVEEFNEIKDTPNLEIAPSNETITLEGKVRDYKLNSYKELSSREKEAFYGEDAQKALGLKTFEIKESPKKLIK